WHNPLPPGGYSVTTAHPSMAGDQLLDVLQSRPVVIFGAGALGRRIAGTLNDAGIPAAAFADNNAALHGRHVGDVPVYSAMEAADRFGLSGLFIIAVWRPASTGGLRDIDLQLRGLGCESVIAFPPVQRLFPEKLLPHYLWDLPSLMENQKASIDQALSLFADEASRREFLAQVEFRR